MTALCQALPWKTPWWPDGFELWASTLAAQAHATKTKAMPHIHTLQERARQKANRPALRNTTLSSEPSKQQHHSSRLSCEKRRLCMTGMQSDAVNASRS